MAVVRPIFVTLILILGIDSVAEQVFRPFFYKIGKSDKVSYVLGTIHQGVELSDLPPVVAEEAMAARIIMVEHVQPEDWVRTFFTDRLANYFKYLSEGEALTQSERDYLAREWGVPPQLAARVKSRDCPVMYYNDPGMEKSLEAEVLRIGYNKKAPLVTLDDEKLLQEIFVQFGNWRECDLRESMRSNAQEYYAGVTHLIDDYRVGDVQAISVDSMSPMIFRRNEGWIPKIEPELDKGGVFIAVGAGHLFTRTGILE